MRQSHISLNNPTLNTSRISLHKRKIIHQLFLIISSESLWISKHRFSGLRPSKYTIYTAYRPALRGKEWFSETQASYPNALYYRKYDLIRV